MEGVRFFYFRSCREKHGLIHDGSAFNTRKPGRDKVREHRTEELPSWSFPCVSPGPHWSIGTEFFHSRDHFCCCLNAGFEMSLIPVIACRRPKAKLHRNTKQKSTANQFTIAKREPLLATPYLGRCMRQPLQARQPSRATHRLLQDG